jgi:hypothetical protein
MALESFFSISRKSLHSNLISIFLKVLILPESFEESACMIILTFVVLVPHSQCSLRENPKFSTKFGSKNNTLVKKNFG